MAFLTAAQTEETLRRLLTPPDYYDYNLIYSTPVGLRAVRFTYTLIESTEDIKILGREYLIANLGYFPADWEFIRFDFQRRFPKCS
jgi:hypothetical protein